VDQLCSTIG